MAGNDYDKNTHDLQLYIRDKGRNKNRRIKCMEKYSVFVRFAKSIAILSEKKEYLML
jgi:hypothetical protein